MVKTAFLLALLAGLNAVVSVTRISSLAEVVTCSETTTGNAFANPSWESGTSGWEYNCTFLRRSQRLVASTLIRPFSDQLRLRIMDRVPDYNRFLQH